MDEFSELLNKDFRWPTAGDKAFTRSSRNDDAWIAHDRSRFALMIWGYNLAADKLVQATVDEPHSRDALVYPIVFGYRHFLELSLKYIVATYGPRVGVRPNWKSHDLTAAWTAYRSVIDAYQASDEADAAVAECIAEFAKIDVGSFSFRYPTDTSGRPLELGIQTLDLTQLRDVMDGIALYFDGTDGYLDHLSQAV